MVQKDNCIGCQACVDRCAQKAISFQYDEWGEGRAVVDASECNNCGLCETCCPSLVTDFNKAQKNVLAAYSKSNRQTGSSGGIFFELASKVINDGGVVFGAAFDENLKLIHKSARSVSELEALCKSKYLHSDMSGVYNEILDCLKKGLKVMFVGTPCQVSAVKNLFSKKYDRQLLLIDFLCHGTGTQKIFDLCIKNEEKKKNGKIVKFVFRAKTKNRPHNFCYTIEKAGKMKKVAGYPFEFPYYYSYSKRNILNEYCYECKFAKQERVGDITIGDFWGVRKYNKKLNELKGVSMLSVNTQKGKDAFELIKDGCTVCEYPIEHASSSNQAFREKISESCHKSKLALLTTLNTKGEEALMKKLSCPNVKKEKIYVHTPMFIKKIWNGVKK